MIIIPFFTCDKLMFVGNCANANVKKIKLFLYIFSQVQGPEKNGYTYDNMNKGVDWIKIEFWRKKDLTSLIKQNES